MKINPIFPFSFLKLTSLRPEPVTWDNIRYALAGSVLLVGYSASNSGKSTMDLGPSTILAQLFGVTWKAV